MLKQHEVADRMHVMTELAGVAFLALSRWFRAKPIPPPDGWDVTFEFTPLGGIIVWCPTTAPKDVRATVFTLGPLLCWLYPGPGEAKALRRIAELEDRLDDVLEAVWSFTELDPEHTITCHADSVPEAYRRACAAIESARSAGTPPDLVAAIEKTERQP